MFTEADLIFIKVDICFSDFKADLRKVRFRTLFSISPYTGVEKDLTFQTICVIVNANMFD